MLTEEEELADSTSSGFCAACGSGDPLALPRSARKDAVLGEEQEQGGLGMWNCTNSDIAHVMRITPAGNIPTDHRCSQIHGPNLLEGTAFHPSVSSQRYRTKHTITTEFARDLWKPLVQHPAQSSIN